MTTEREEKAALAIEIASKLAHLKNRDPAMGELVGQLVGMCQRTADRHRHLVEAISKVIVDHSEDMPPGALQILSKAALADMFALELEHAEIEKRA